MRSICSIFRYDSCYDGPASVSSIYIYICLCISISHRYMPSYIGICRYMSLYIVELMSLLSPACYPSRSISHYFPQMLTLLFWKAGLSAIGLSAASGLSATGLPEASVLAAADLPVPAIQAAACLSALSGLPATGLSAAFGSAASGLSAPCAS